MSLSTIWQNDCQVPAGNGVAPTVANTPVGTNVVNGGSNNAISTPQTGSGNTFVTDTSVVPGASMSAITQTWKVTQASTVVNNQFMVFSASSDICIDYLWRCPNTPTATTTIDRLFTDAGFVTNVLNFTYTTTRKLQLQETGQTAVSSTGALVAGTVYYFRIRYQASTNTATITAYAVGSATVVATATITVVGSYTLQSRRWGIGTASSGMGQMNVGAIRITDGGTPIRQDLADVKPIADAGPDQTVNAFETVTLDGSHSSDPDGTVSSYAYTATVALTNPNTVSPTFVAAASMTKQVVTATLVVTDNWGVASDPDTANITILPHTVWRNKAGVASAVRVLKPGS